MNGERSTLNGKRNKVVVAMSGGVDSSVTAALLKQQGFDVTGITMQIWPDDLPTVDGGCCSLSAVEDARSVAQKLDIAFYVLNFRQIFQEKVINNFLDEYRNGRTPNPCIRCNHYVKFEALLTKAKALGADYLATGHYARIEFSKVLDRYLLKKGIDKGKDQSYVLYTMTQEQLASTIMPLGDLTKKQCRQIADQLELRVADKPESQEICFIPDNNYRAYLKEKSPAAFKSGPIYDIEGNVIGTHEGILNYTIGQRKGLGVTSHEPLFVIGINNNNNSISVGPKSYLNKKSFIAEELNLILISKLSKPLRARVQIRYNMNPASATIIPVDNRVEVIFDKPQSAITPGQAAVFYDGENVIGGATIHKYL